MTKLDVLKKQYQKAVERFEEILEKEKNDIIRDSAIKRFEFVFDLSWKLIKAFLEEEKGIKCVSPKECFKEAYRQNIIDYSDKWLKMTNWRNEAVHTYGEKFADELYGELSGTLKHFKLLKERIAEE